MVAARHRLVEDVLQDRREVEVDVVAAHVELDRGDLAGGHGGVDPVDERDELLRREPAERDDRPLLAGARVVVAQVGVDPDVAPAERVDPAGVGAAQDRRVAPQQPGQLAQRVVVAGAEVALAGLDGERPGGHGPELGERHEQRDRAHPVRQQRGVGDAVAEQARRGDQPVAEHDVAQADAVGAGLRPGAQHGADATGAGAPPAGRVGCPLVVIRPDQRASPAPRGCGPRRRRVQRPHLRDAVRRVAAVRRLDREERDVLVVGQVEPGPGRPVGERHARHQLPRHVPGDEDVAHLDPGRVGPDPRPRDAAASRPRRTAPASPSRPGPRCGSRPRCRCCAGRPRSPRRTPP